MCYLPSGIHLLRQICVYRLHTRGSKSLQNKIKKEKIEVQIFKFISWRTFLTLLIYCSFSKHFISSSSIDLVSMEKLYCSVCFGESERVHSIEVSPREEKEGRKERLIFSGNNCLRVHFSFDVGLNIVSIIQIHFPFLLFVSYRWTSGNRFSMQEIYTQGGFDSLLSFFPRASLKYLPFGGV